MHKGDLASKPVGLLYYGGTESCSGVSRGTAEILEEVTSQDLVKLHLFRDSLYRIRIRDIVECTLFTEGVTPFKGSNY